MKSITNQESVPKPFALPFAPAAAAPARAVHRGHGMTARAGALFAAAAVLLLAGVGWCALRSAPRGGKVGPAAYARLREGMSREQAEAAVGLAPGDYRDRAHKPGGVAYTEWQEEA